jgi:membrane protein implicated in regulation of membrane protease activity
MDPDNWQWIWVGAAVILAIGELLTAGFFLLPFAVGAAAAAVLAFLGAGFVWQLLVFVIVSVSFLAILQRYARTEPSETPARAGADRYHGRTALVMEDIDWKAGTGQVRMETEDWRATTEDHGNISRGTKVKVIRVTGTRLVVEAIDAD